MSLNAQADLDPIVLPIWSCSGEREKLPRWGLHMTHTGKPVQAMETSPVGTSTSVGPVTFSQVFGQQSQLLEAGKETSLIRDEWGCKASGHT